MRRPVGPKATCRSFWKTSVSGSEAPSLSDGTKMAPWPVGTGVASAASWSAASGASQR